MPLGLDPQDTVSVVLDADKTKPEGQRPTFIFRYLSARAMRRLWKLEDKARELSGKKDEDAALAAICDAIRIGLEDWKNMIVTSPAKAAELGMSGPGELPFAPEKLEDLITDTDCWELLFAAVGAMRLGESEKKASPSPSPSAAEKSAGAAAGESASTNQPPSNPSSSATAPAPSATATTPAA